MKNRLVCIKQHKGPCSREGKRLPNSDLPVKGEIYTYRGEEMHKGYILLFEIGNGFPERPEVSYEATGFRPVDFEFGEVQADYIEQTAFKEYQYEEATR